VEETAGAVTVMQPANTTSATHMARATARPSVSLPDLVSLRSDPCRPTI
jgi:hypothetical protein